MTVKKFAATLGLALALGAAATLPVVAANGVPLDPQRAQSEFNLGGDISVPANDTRDGDVVALGGDVVIDGTVTRNVVLFGGNVTINGTVERDVADFGGNVTLGPHASVGRDVVIAGGNLNKDPAAQIGGRVVYGQNGNFNFGRYVFPSIITTPHIGFPWFNWFGVGFGLISAIGLILLGLLILLFFPSQLQATGATLEQRPLESLGLGCGGFLAGVALAILFFATIFLIPASFAVAIVMTAAWMFGWAALFLITGQRLLRSTNQRQDLVLALLLGGVLLGLLANIPLMNLLVISIGGSLALGAAIYSRFGTRPPQTPAAGSSLPAPPAPPSTPSPA